MADEQIPRGRQDMWCPMWRKRMSAVCHTCPWWNSIKIENAQNGENVEKWGCAVALGPMISLDTGRQTRGVQAAIENARNETSKLLAEGILRQERQHIEAVAMAPRTPPRALNSNRREPQQIEMVKEKDEAASFNNDQPN